MVTLTVLIYYYDYNALYGGLEERSYLNKFGDTYREYMNRTPRCIGIPKLGKK